MYMNSVYDRLRLLFKKSPKTVGILDHQFVFIQESHANDHRSLSFEATSEFGCLSYQIPLLATKRNQLSPTSKLQTRINVAYDNNMFFLLCL